MRIAVIMETFILALAAGTTFAQSPSTAPTQVREVGVYTCPAHPDMQATWPAQCPICQTTLAQVQPSASTRVGTIAVADRDDRDRDRDRERDRRYGYRRYGYAYPPPGYRYYPNQGYYFNPNTGYYFYPNNGYFYDPRTGRYFYSNPGYSYSPNDRYYYRR
jgi:hypothetical protein